MTTYAGQSVRRFEDHRLLTGLSSYVDDMQLPGMLHALVLRSPHAHAVLRSIDTSAAAAMPGVAAVITAADLSGLAAQLPTRLSTEADDIRPPRHPVLADGKVCYVGQAVAIVVAEDIYMAADALERIVTDYDLLPSVIDPSEALAEGAPVVHEDLGNNICLRTVNSGGDIDGALCLRRPGGQPAIPGAASRPGPDGAPRPAGQLRPGKTTSSAYGTRPSIPTKCGSTWSTSWDAPKRACGWPHPTSAAGSGKRAVFSRRRWRSPTCACSWAGPSSGSKAAKRTCSVSMGAASTSKCRRRRRTTGRYWASGCAL